MPSTHDGQHHVLRIMALDQLQDAGVMFSRWQPHMAYGYGLPIFNYYSPLVYLPAVAARQLGAGYAAAFELTAALSLVASALAMFGLARVLFPLPAALTAALVYAYLPYQLVDLYVRGALAESAAFVWLPLAAWCLLRLQTRPARRWELGLAFTVAGLVLTHNITALIAAPALAALAALLWAAPNADGSFSRRSYLARAAGAALIGLGLAAWYWLPALYERDLVQLGAALSSKAVGGTFDFETGSPLQSGLIFDYGDASASAPNSPPGWGRLGLLQFLICLVGAAAAFGAQGLARWVLAWAAGLVVVAWGLQSSAAVPLYEQIPLFAFVQFAWRLLSLVGLGSALLAAGVVAVAPSRPGAILAAALIGLSGWAGLAGLLPDYTFPDDRYLSLETLVRADVAGEGLGTTWFGEYLPVATGQADAEQLRRALLGDGPPREPAALSPPPAFQIEALDWTPLSIFARVAAPQADRLVIHQFAFPGWSARIDGVAAPLAPGGPLSLLAVDVPAGTHDIEFRFGWTNPRLAGLLLSVLAVLGLVMLAGRSNTRRPPSRPGRTASVGVGVSALTAVLFGGFSPWPAVGVAAPALAQPRAPNGSVALIGATLDTTRLIDGGPLAVRLTWLELAGSGNGYEANVRVEATNGAVHETRWSYAALSRHWQRGELVRTETDLRLPLDFPAGDALVSIQVGPSVATGGTLPSTVRLGLVSVPPPRSVASSERFATRADLRLAPGVELESYELRGEGALGRLDLRVGEMLDAYVTWRVNGPPEQELAAVLDVRGPRGSATRWAHLPRQWFNPSFAWQAGDHFRQQLRYVVQSDLPSGEYVVSLQLYAGDRLSPFRVPSGRFRFLDQVPLGTLVVRP